MADEELEADIRRVSGYLELGMAAEALDELDEIGVVNGVLLRQRAAALMDLGRWRELAILCLPMTHCEPEALEWWIHAAYAVRRDRSVEEAEELLKASLDHHPLEPLPHYNLACYACVQGHHQEARAHLLEALRHGREEVLRMAPHDEDLRDLHEWLEQLCAESGP